RKTRAPPARPHSSTRTMRRSRSLGLGRPRPKARNDVRVQTASAAEPETRLMSGVCLSPAYLETARLTSRSSAEARQGKRSDFPNSPSGISGNPFRAHAVPDPTGQRYQYRLSAFVLQILHDGPERTGPDCRSLRLLESRD